MYYIRKGQVQNPTSTSQTGNVLFLSGAGQLYPHPSLAGQWLTKV